MCMLFFCMPAGDWTSWTDDILDILRLMGLQKDDYFKLSSVYIGEKILSKIHPNNNHIKAKIRQQLQILRDYGYILFTQKKGLYQLAVDINEMYDN